jgi:uncharacterized membrane protein YozB (DUF420 family)
MASPWARDRATHFYVGFGFVGIAAIAIGFSTTFVLPMYRGTFVAPAVVHLHGALAVSWVVLLISQSFLVRAHLTPLHRRVGLIGLPLALGILITGVMVGFRAARRDFPSQGPVAASSIIGVLTTLSLFALLVGLAILWRRWPDWHKRLMLLATILVLWPAWFRFRHLLPWVSHANFWLSYVVPFSPIGVAALRDRWKYGFVHPVWVYFGTGIILEQGLEMLAFDSAPWRAVGLWLFQTFGWVLLCAKRQAVATTGWGIGGEAAVSRSRAR